MPDMDIFDPAGFFVGKMRELEEQVIEKKARLELHRANKHNLERTLTTLGRLDPAQQKALQLEIVALTDALESTNRTIETTDAEVAALLAKLAALRAARDMVESPVPEG